MKHLVLGVALGLLWAHSQSVFGQASAVQWSSVAKITNGTCGDNAIAYVSEQSGSMHLRLTYANGKQYAEFDVTLATDGSGRAEFPGSMGLTILEISAGSGKRLMKTIQKDGICQWTWAPK